MSQLLNIKSTPVSLEYNVTRAELKQEYTPAEMELNREKGGLDISSDPIKVQIDNTAARESLGLGHLNTDTFIKNYADEGVQTANSAVKQIVNEGNALMKKQATPASQAAAHLDTTKEVDTGFLPSEQADITWTGGTMDMNFTADQLEMKWNTNNKPKSEYTPGSVEFVVSQTPKVEIEYVGEPIYFPKSSAPGYEE